MVPAPRAVSSTHPTWMEIDGAALAGNLAEIRRRARPCVKVIASVKANAYGHGIVPVAAALEAAGVDMLATGSFAEATALRAAGGADPRPTPGGNPPRGNPALVGAALTPNAQ